MDKQLDELERRLLTGEITDIEVELVQLHLEALEPLTFERLFDLGVGYRNVQRLSRYIGIMQNIVIDAQKRAPKKGAADEHNTKSRNHDGG